MGAVEYRIGESGVADLLADVNAKGVKLWVAKGQLRYRMPKGALSPADVDRLAFHHDEIVSFFRKYSGDARNGQGPGPRRPGASVPLTYFQRVRWDLRLQHGVSVRQISSATHLRGRLSASVLRTSLHEVVRRHEALRTRIVVRDGTPEQVVNEDLQIELRTDDLSRLTARASEKALMRLIEQFIVEPLRIDVAPLFGVLLVRLRDDEHVLVIALEHVIADACSAQVLLRDLFHIYARTLLHGPPLPAVPVQFADYAIWQRGAEAGWVAEHSAHWEALRRCAVQRFPESGCAAPSAVSGWGGVSVKIDGKLKARLVEWCRLRGTTLPLGVFVSYAAAVLRWCGTSRCVIRYVTNGRELPEIENSIGPYATSLYLRLELHECDSFTALLEQATQEYHTAYYHADFFYLQAAGPVSDVLESCIFNWIPTEPSIDLSALDGSEYALTCSDVPFVNPLYDRLDMQSEPMALLHDRQQEISVAIMFPRQRFASEAMQSFADTFLTLLDAALSDAGQPISLVPLSGQVRHSA